MRARGIDVPQPIAAILAPTGITPSHVITAEPCHACAIWNFDVHDLDASNIPNISQLPESVYSTSIFAAYRRGNHGGPRPNP